MSERRFTLVCPVKINDDGDLCEKDIDVWAEPGHKGSRDEPAEGPGINDVRANNCDHGEELRKGTYDDDLLQQIVEETT